MSSLPEILDAAIIRNPQPDDVLVLKVPASTTQYEVDQARMCAEERIGCKVVIITANVELASSTGDVA